MSKHNNEILQKLKDNAFYVALGLGLVAILAVVAVYTLERSGTQIAENELDLNTASDYVIVEDTQQEVEETNGKTADHTDELERDTIMEEMLSETESKTQEQETEVTSVIPAPVDEPEENYPLPVTADAGELNFNSESTISWPVNGEVILPYSMETTVYFKTLDQYKCNPGMMIAAGNGTTVKNVFLGKVTKVTSDDIYGNMVTVYLGNDYSIVYGQLDTIYVKEGDFVKAGDSIGTIGNPTDSFTEEGSHLFFQMYDKDTVIDPSLFMV